MAVNGYFNNFPSQNRLGNEHSLMEDVIVESIQIMGHNCYYIPRESLDNVDMIFGETTKVKFKHAYIIEAYIANAEGYEGDHDFFSKFGLEIRDTSNFVISRRSFARIVPSALRERPQEGDLVWVPLLHRMFEIKFIEKKLMFYSLGNRHPFVFEMRCEVFRYSEEDFDTGIGEIDQVEEDNGYTIKLTLNTSGSGSFRDNEVVYQSPDGTWANATATAEVSEWFAANGTMLLHNIMGTFSPSANVYGNTSQAIFSTTANGVDATGDFVMQDFFNNDDFGKSTELILDLSEINPFGTP
jgi:hypothetical protein